MFRFSTFWPALLIVFEPDAVSDEHFAVPSPPGPVLFGPGKPQASIRDEPSAGFSKQSVDFAPPLVTSPVAFEVAEAEPVLFVAVTMTRILWPTSVDASVYVAPVAPLTFEQHSPAVLQSCHW